MKREFKLDWWAYGLLHIILIILFMNCIINYHKNLPFLINLLTLILVGIIIINGKLLKNDNKKNNY